MPATAQVIPMRPVHTHRTFAGLISAAKAEQEKAEGSEGKTAYLYMSLGAMLAEAKSRIDEAPKGTTWAKLVRREFNYSRKRADELIRIANGTTTVEKSREGKRKRVRKSRRKKRVLRSTRSRGSRRMPINQQVNHLTRGMTALIDDWVAEVEIFLAANPNLKSDYRSAVIRHLTLTADRLMVFAQNLDDR